MQLRLGDDDRKRLNVDVEWLDFDLGSVTVNEAIVLQAAAPHGAGYRGGLAELRDAWVAQIRRDDTGEVTGVTEDYQAQKAAMWCALHRAGTTIPYAELDFTVGEVQLRQSPTTDDETGDVAVEAAVGKDPSTPTPTSET